MEIAQESTSQCSNDYKSPLVQVKAWWPSSKNDWHRRPAAVVLPDVISVEWVNTLRLRQNGYHFPDDIFKCIFLNENVWVSIQISLEFASGGTINNTPVLVQIMAWRRLGDKLLSEPMVVRLTTLKNFYFKMPNAKYQKFCLGLKWKPGLYRHDK